MAASRSPRLRFTLRQLEYLVAVGEAGTIAEAAHRLNVSSPSISAAISQLEAEFGVQLFVRKPAHGLSLSAAGRLFLNEAKLLLRQGHNLYNVAHELQHELSGTLSVGCMVTLAPVMAPELCKSFMDAHPGVRIELHEGSHEDLLRKLSNVEIDIALSYDMARPDTLSFEPLSELEPHAVVSANSPLAALDTVSLEQLAGEPLVLLDLPYSAQYFLSLFEARGLVPNVIARSGNQDVIRTMVANDYGYTILNVRPKSMVAMDGRKLKAIRLAEQHTPTRIGVMTLAGTVKPRMLAAFEEHCRKTITRETIPGMMKG
jgi:DNA-binding transcriptional LysR family regulator